MSILINENLLRLSYLQETGRERPEYRPVSDYADYVDWLEEKLSIVIQEQKLHEEKLSIVIQEQKLHEEILSKISTKEYGEDGVWLSKEVLDECLYK